MQISFTACGPGCYKEPTLSLEHHFLGTKGSLSCGYSWDPENQLQQYLELTDPRKGRISIDLNEKFPSHYEHFMDCLCSGREPIVSALDARNALAVVEAAYQSINTGGKINVNWRT